MTTIGQLAREQRRLEAAIAELEATVEPGEELPAEVAENINDLRGEWLKVTSALEAERLAELAGTPENPYDWQMGEDSLPF